MTNNCQYIIEFNSNTYYVYSGLLNDEVSSVYTLGTYYTAEWLKIDLSHVNFLFHSIVYLI